MAMDAGLHIDTGMTLDEAARYVEQGEREQYEQTLPEDLWWELAAEAAAALRPLLAPRVAALEGDNDERR
jgi:hypothetical protein